MGDRVSSALLLVNPVSGGGKAIKQYERVAKQLTDGGYQLRIHISVDQADLSNQVLAATEPIIFLLAGDGSLRAAAEVIVRNELTVQLAPLPAGRGNDFCASLGIPKNPHTALAQLLTEPKALKVDVISINNEFIALGAISIGIDANAAAISVEIQQQGNTWLKGAPLYLVSAIRALARWRSKEVVVSIDGGPATIRKIWLFVVSNSGQFGGGMKISPTSKLTDGQLEIIAVGEVTKFDFIKTLPKVFFGKHMNHPKLELLTANEVFIDSMEQILSFADGEPICHTPLKIKVISAALNILK